MNDADVQAPNTDCKPKLHKNYKLVLQIWLVNHNVVPGTTKMLIQEHVTLGKIRFCRYISPDNTYVKIIEGFVGNIYDDMALDVGKYITFPYGCYCKMMFE